VDTTDADASSEPPQPARESSPLADAIEAEIGRPAREAAISDVTNGAPIISDGLGALLTDEAAARVVQEARARVKRVEDVLVVLEDVLALVDELSLEQKVEVARRLVAKDPGCVRVFVEEIERRRARDT
jgi:hypothetical protein